jgi:hypothetical protein
LVYESGNKERECWYIDDKKHNENGPAEILYYESGNKGREIWYIDGKELTEDEFNKLKSE